MRRKNEAEFILSGGELSVVRRVRIQRIGDRDLRSFNQRSQSMRQWADTMNWSAPA
jgi:hypothetical protein